MTCYPKSVQILHWLMAAGLIGMVLVGLYMGSLPLSAELRDALMMGHLATGLLLLIAVAIRLRWRMQGRMPGVPSVYRGWERVLVRIVHTGFYGLMIGLPLLGLSVWLLDPFVFGPGLAGQSIALANLAGWLHWGHYLGAWLLLALVSIHVAGALRGLFSADPERRVLLRMLGSNRPDQAATAPAAVGRSRSVRARRGKRKR
jgi:cytochrome b561